MDKNYDVMVIGGGSAGFSVLEQIAHKGLKIALVENRKLGGSCPNFACVPSKALIKCAQVLNTVKKASHFGITTGAYGFNWQKVQKYRAQIVAETEEGHSEKVLKDKGVDLIWGTAKFTSPYEIEVNGQKYQADKFAITTGSKPTIADIEGLKDSGFLISDQAVELKKLPKQMVILGAGPVGCELAQMFARFKVAVTIINHGKQILDREEPEVSAKVKKLMENDGVKFILEGEVTKVSRKGNLKEVGIKIKSKEKTLVAEDILIATGRVPNIDSLEIEKTHINMKNGKVLVNDYLQTSHPHIFMAGDALGKMLFTHVAYYQGSIIGKNILGGKVKADLRVVPRGTFTDPEVGSVGIMEKEAKNRGYSVETVSFEYGGSRSFITSDPAGFIKITFNKKNRRILGASMVGKYAAEIIHIIALAMYKNLTIDDVSSMIYAYPTYAGGSLAGMV